MADELCPAQFADLNLVVGNEQTSRRTFRVMKSTLRMHSTAFERLFTVQSSQEHAHTPVASRAKIQQVAEIADDDLRTKAQNVLGRMSEYSLDEVYVSLILQGGDMDRALQLLMRSNVYEVLNAHQLIDYVTTGQSSQLSEEPTDLICEVELPDDDPAAFDILLKIVYHKVSGLSSRPNGKHLLAVTRLADKYDLISLTRSCINTWIMCMSNAEREVELAPEELYFIGWTLGLKSIFKQGWRRLIDRIYCFKSSATIYRVEKRRDGWAVGGELLQRDLLPDGTLGQVTSRNTAEENPANYHPDEICDLATQRLHTLHKEMQRFVHDVTCGLKELECYQGGEANRGCEIVMVGVLVKPSSFSNIPTIFEPEAIVATRRPTLGLQTIAETRAQLLRCVEVAAGNSHKDCVPTTEWIACIDRALKWSKKLNAGQEEHLSRFDR